MKEIHAVNEIKPKRGRKPRLIPRKAITVRLEPSDADGLRFICKRRRLSQANWVAEKIGMENAEVTHPESKP